MMTQDPPSCQIGKTPEHRKIQHYYHLGEHRPQGLATSYVRSNVVVNSTLPLLQGLGASQQDGNSVTSFQWRI